MAYTPPAGDSANFNFVGDAYTPPGGDSVNFNFTEAEPLPNNLLILGMQWEVEAPPLPVALLGMQWGVEAEGGEGTIFLGMQFAVVAASERRSLLGMEWEVEHQPFAVSSLGMQFAVVAPFVRTSILGARWGVFAGFGTTMLGAQWGVDGVHAPTSRLGMQWEVVGQPFGVSIFGMQWLVEEAPAASSSLGMQWSVDGIATAESQLGFQWEVLTPMEATSILGMQWGFLEYVDAEVELRWQDVIEAEVELPAPIGLGIVGNEVALQLPIVDQALAVELVLNLALGDVAAELDIDARLLDTVGVEIELLSPMLASVAAGVDLDLPIKLTSDIETELILLSPILGASQVIPLTQPALVIHGQVIELASVSISMDEGQFAWTCEAQLLDPRQYSLFTADSIFSVTVGAETYVFRLENRQMARSGVATMQASISGISPSASLANPRAARVTRIWDAPVLARAAAIELSAGLLAEADWGIIDWSIPAFRLAATNEAPIEIIGRIAAAAGGIVESKPDGTLYVRYAFPRAVADFGGTPDQEYTDVLDRFSVSEGYAAVPLVNRLRILDAVPGAYSDVLEFEADRMNPSAGRLLVYPSPWRTTFELSHTSLPLVSIERVGVVTRDLTETVEAIRGEASVRYPIHAVLALQWLYTDLGGVSFQADQRQLRTTIPGESLLRITYRTRFVEYRTVAFDGAEVQYLVKEPELG